MRKKLIHYLTFVLLLICTDLYSQPYLNFNKVDCAQGPQAGPPLSPYNLETDWYKLMHDEICIPESTNCTQCKGAIWCNEPLSLETSFTIEFLAYFGIRNDDRPTSDHLLWGADGIAFVLQRKNIPPNNQPNAIGSWGKFIGYGGDNIIPGINPSYTIEFDTYFNFQWDPTVAQAPNEDHIQIVKNGDMYSTDIVNDENQSDYYQFNLDIENGQVHNIKIEWNYDTKNLKVWFDQTKVVEHIINLPNFFNSNLGDPNSY